MVVCVFYDDMSKQRLDVLLVEHGLVASREKAKALILAGEVRVAGQRVRLPSALIPTDAPLVLDQPPPFVGRGGLKLAHALTAFGVDPTGRPAADIGASTGGFTDCLLQQGAVRVYAIDVGYGQLDYRLRQDPRVVVRERVNARYLEELPEPVDLMTIDVSFISVRLILPAVRRVLGAAGQVVVLIKPQFEAGRAQVGKKGIVRDPAVHRAVLTEFCTWAAEAGWTVRGLTDSPIRGAEGNREFFALLALGGPAVDAPACIESLIPEPIAGEGS